MGCLYKLTSPSGKSYIGISKHGLEKRWKKHVECALGSKERSSRISDSVKKAMALPDVRKRFLAGIAKRNLEPLRAAGRRNLGRKNAPATESRKALIRAAQLRSWSNPEIKARRLVGMAKARKPASQEARARAAEKSRQQWADPVLRPKLLEAFVKVRATKKGNQKLTITLPA